jgi:hypothetical protein
MGAGRYLPSLPNVVSFFIGLETKDVDLGSLVRMVDEGEKKRGILSLGGWIGFVIQ